MIKEWVEGAEVSDKPYLSLPITLDATLRMEELAMKWIADEIYRKFNITLKE